MSAGIGSIAGGVTHVPNKNSIWVGDTFTADASMPGWVTTTTDKITMLPALGYRPSLEFINPWIGSGNSMVYDGITLYWTGTGWYNSVTTRVVLAANGNVGCRADFSRMPIAKRIDALNRLYSPSPATPWTSSQYSTISTINPSGATRMGHIIKWNGTSWEFISTAPEYTGLPWDKTLTPGTTAPMEPTITAQDATNAAKIAGLGYTMNPPIGAPGLAYSYAAITFPSPSSPSSYYFFYWNGTAWTTTAAGNSIIYPNSNIAHAGIAAQPAENRAWFAQGYGLAGGQYPWSPTTYATIGTAQVSGVATYGWYPGPHPGTLPPVPNKTALLPGDIFTDPVVGVPPMPTGLSSNMDNSIVYWLMPNGFLPNSSDKLAWRAASPKVIRYVNVNASWNGTHWTTPLPASKIAIAPTDQPYGYSKFSSYPAIGSLPTAADRIAVVGSYWSANPASAWTAAQNQWFGGTIMTWDGTTWVELCSPMTIHEAATYPAFPGDYFLDTRVNGNTSVIANQLLGWGYVPGFRAPWYARIDTAWGGQASIYFGDTTGASGSIFPYHWNGTTWVTGTAPTGGTIVAPSAVVTDAAISALPAAEQIIACTYFTYYSNTGAQWTTGQSATIAGNVVHWHGGSSRRYWAPGAAP